VATGFRFENENEAQHP